MFQTWPCDKAARVTQEFGENPAWYEKFGIPAHNGRDFALPVGSALYAVDEGRVIEVNNDVNGYGLYVKVDHDWGETIYAHMSRQLVKTGDAVGAGQRLGLSGNTGNSTGPHLHFGVRVKPYSRTEGWLGWTDPKPFFDMLAQGRPYRMGPYLAGSDVSSMLDTLARWQPAVVTAMDLSRDVLLELRRVLPSAKIVYRIYRPDGEVSERIRSNPDEAARWIDSTIRGHEAFGVADYYFIANEVCQVDWQEWHQLSRCMGQWIDLAGDDYGCGLYAFSVGNPDMPEHDRLAYWRVTVPTLEKAIRRGHVLLLHQYGAPNLTDPDEDWYTYRFEHQNILARLDAERAATARATVPSLLALGVVVQEFGIDWLIHHVKGGFRRNLSDEQYAAQLIDAERHTLRYPHVKGYTVFTCGTANPNDWALYDIWQGAANLLARDAEQLRGQNWAVVPTPTPEPVQEAISPPLAALKEKAEELRAGLRFNIKAALQKRITSDGCLVAGNEGTVSDWVVQLAYDPRTGDERFYYVNTSDFSDVRWK